MPPSKGKIARHTPENVQLMLELYNKGLTIRQVAKQTSFSYGSIQKYLKSYGVLRPPGTTGTAVLARLNQGG
jgi:hypothetical protein